MNAQPLEPIARGVGPQGSLVVLILLLAACHSGCCCYECIPHGTAPLKYVPPISALTPRNPPCSYVDPMCYGYHATCWRSWPADCVPDCMEWYQQDAIGPAKGEGMPSLAPMPPLPEQPQAPLPTPAPAQEQPKAEEGAFLLPAQSATDSAAPPAEQTAGDYATLPPIITVRDVPERENRPISEPLPYSSRRSYEERHAGAELP